MQAMCRSARQQQDVARDQALRPDAGAFDDRRSTQYGVIGNLAGPGDRLIDAPWRSIEAAEIELTAYGYQFEETA
jgi:hypothetical protein